MADYLDPARRRAAVYGYRLVFRASFDHDEDDFGNPTGWTDHRNRICYVFTDTFDHFPVAQRVRTALKISIHEVGHARWRNVRRTPTYWRGKRAAWLGTDQQVEEDYCETYAYSIYTRESVFGEPAYLSGVSYSFRSPIPSHSRIMTTLTTAL